MKGENMIIQNKDVFIVFKTWPKSYWLYLQFWRTGVFSWQNQGQRILWNWRQNLHLCSAVKHFRHDIWAWGELHNCKEQSKRFSPTRCLFVGDWAEQACQAEKHYKFQRFLWPHAERICWIADNCSKTGVHKRGFCPFVADRNRNL